MMERVLERLQECNEDVSLGLELPDEDRLVEVEEEILLPLPPDLRTYLLEASDVIYGHLEPVTAADRRSHTYLPEMTSVAWSVGVPRDYIPVCEYDGGYACIGQDGKVLFWSDGQMQNDEWEDLWEWIDDVWLG